MGVARFVLKIFSFGLLAFMALISVKIALSAKYRSRLIG